MIPHSRPTISDEDTPGVLAVLKSGCLVQGEQVAGFEDDMAAYVGVRSAVAVSSGTAALHLALLALDIGGGDEVIIPSFVCTALLNAVRYVGASPVPADIDPGHYNLSVPDVTRRITDRTKALIVPHLFGQAADLEELLNLGVPVIEDCAQSLGSRYRNRMTGSFGVLAIFSFYATKLIATGEGGMVASDRPDLLEKVRDLRDYDEKDDDRIRYNYKLTEMQAVLGRSQLRQLPGFLERRAAIAARYDAVVRQMGWNVPETYAHRNHIYFRYVLRQRDAAFVIGALNARGIACRRPVYRPLHHDLGLCNLPVTESVWQETFSLPIYPSLTDGDVSEIVSALEMLRKKG